MSTAANEEALGVTPECIGQMDALEILHSEAQPTPETTKDNR